MQQEVLRLSAQGHGDAEVARRLSGAGFRSPSRSTVLPATVREIRLRHGILLHPGQSRPRRVAGHLTVTALAKKLGVLRHWIYDRIHNGVIHVRKDGRSGTYLIPDDRRTLEQFDDVPVRSYVLTIAERRIRDCLREAECADKGFVFNRGEDNSSDIRAVKRRDHRRWLEVDPTGCHRDP